MKYSIKEARIKSQLTCCQMAEKLGLSEKNYIKYEQYEKIFRIEQAYHFSKITKIALEQITFVPKK